MDAAAVHCHETFRYNPATGEIFRKGGDQSVGSKHSRGYLCISCRPHGVLLAHRIAWLLQTGEWPSALIDHINCDKTDNRFANLRLASPHESVGNIRIGKSNTSGFKGVHFNRANGSWQAQIRTFGKSTYLGSFATPELAHAAYCAAAARLFGEYARAA